MDRTALVEGYVLGTLSAVDMAEAEVLRTSDAAFNEEVEILQALRQAIARSEHNDIRQMLQKFERQRQTAPVKTITKRIKGWAIAASLLLVCSLAYWLYPDGNLTTDLYASYYKTMPNIVLPVVRGQQEQDAATLAFAAYEQANYLKAETLFATIYESKNEPYALFYQGMCKLELGDAAGCIMLLESTSFGNERYPLADYSVWYLALANIKLNKLEKAVQQLELAAQQGKPYETQASALLTKLRRRL